MELIQKYQGGKKTRRRSTMPDFNRMKSIYNEDGTLKSYSDLGFSSQEDLYKTLETTIGKGYGSFTSNGEDYTIYQKDSQGNIIKPWEQEQYKGQLQSLTDNPEYYKDAEKSSYNNLGLMAAANYINKPKKGGYPAYRPIFNSEVSVETPVETQIETPVETPTSSQSTNQNTPGAIADQDVDYSYIPDYGLTTTQFRNLFYGTPETGRRSQLRKHVGLIEDWQARQEDLKKGIKLSAPFVNEDPLNTLKFILNNADLTEARRGKGENYLYMESDRLNRDIGGYKGLRYRDLLNYFSPENAEKYSSIYGNGRYKDRYDDFYKRLYNLSASRNGMQGGELDDLFGKGYDQVLRDIAKDLGIAGYQQGGVIEMLFI